MCTGPCDLEVTDHQWSIGFSGHYSYTLAPEDVLTAASSGSLTSRLGRRPMDLVGGVDRFASRLRVHSFIGGRDLGKLFIVE